MPAIQGRSIRPAFGAGFAVALGLLAGCESGSGTPPPPPTANVAGLAPLDGAAVTGDPRQAVLQKLAQVGDRVHFDTDRYDLSTVAEGTLRQQAALLQAYPGVTVTIEGHADERGTREYNLALADRRAATVRNYLAALGVAGERVETISYGKERPDCAEASEGCWAANRRGVTTVNQ